jgi:poly(hydroxyalkanoate) depolymerase family esterase
MNELAEAHGFLVAYPAQSVRANGGNCWNWFSRSEQSRGGEEPSLIAGIAREIGQTYRIDESRVFAAGLSAGAAMAVILGATYPEVFRAVAAHSGLPLGAAHDVASAFAAMQGRPSPADFTGRPIRDTERFADARPHAVPTLILHGDADATVTPSNGDAIAEQAVRSFSIASKHALKKERFEKSRGGRACVITRHIDEAGNTKVEQWSVQGGEHAWFGGSADGSFTEAKGPDASAEIVRFFMQQNQGN